MKIRDRATGDVITDWEFRRLHPNTSFPQDLTPALFDEYGYDVVYPGALPPTSGPYEVVVEDGVEQIDGQWYVKHIVGPVFDTPEEEAAYRQRIDDEAAKRVRQERNKRLGETDWTQLVDAPLDATPWAAYRQVLRDITTQPGFPHNVTWPEEPTTY